MLDKICFLMGGKQKDPHHALKEIAKICILADCTLVLAFTYVASSLNWLFIYHEINKSGIMLKFLRPMIIISIAGRCF